MRKCDLDGDGRIDYHEFITAAFDHKNLATEKNLENAFNLLDLNKDGFIDVDEFRIILPTDDKEIQEYN